MWNRNNFQDDSEHTLKNTYEKSEVNLKARKAVKYTDYWNGIIWY